MLKRIAAIAACFLSTFSAHAGMTVYGLKDVIRLRFEEISFFVVLLLISALAVKLLWNYAVKGLAFLPRLNFLRALCLSLIFGMAMLLVLTMISGIREVLTPGAWRKQGTTYRLNAPAQEPVRLRALQHLRVALFEYARTHDGKFPLHDFVPEIAEKLWESPDPEGTHYYYSGGWSTNDVNALIAVEPSAFGEQRFVLTGSGQIKKLSDREIEKQMQAKGEMKQAAPQSTR